MKQLKVSKEKGLVDVPVYMRDYTEKKEYSYLIEYLGLEGKMMKNGKNWWIVSNNAKWIIMGEPTKKQAETAFKQFVDKHHDRLVEKGFIKAS